MVETKPILDTVKTAKAYTVLKSLDHYTRFAIIKYLKEEGKKNVTELCEYFNLEQSVMSNYLRVLRRSKIVRYRRKKGTRFHYYCINETRYLNICRIVKELADYET